jgi:hypothetical protein
MWQLTYIVQIIICIEVLSLVGGCLKGALKGKGLVGCVLAFLIVVLRVDIRKFSWDCMRSMVVYGSFTFSILKKVF